MATLSDAVPHIGSLGEESSRPELKSVGAAPPVLPAWLRAQAINITRHAAALRPFKREEFGTGAAAPSEGHIKVVNDLISKLRGGLLKMSKNVANAVAAANQ